MSTEPIELLTVEQRAELAEALTHWEPLPAADAFRAMCSPAPPVEPAFFRRVLALETELVEARAEVEKLRTEGSPGVMHEVDKAFYDLAVKERDHARAALAQVVEDRDLSARLLAEFRAETSRALVRLDVVDKSRATAQAEVEKLRAEKTLGQMTGEVRDVNIEKGWRVGTNTFGDYIALLHSELSEALEAYRDYRLEDATRPGCGRAASSGEACPEHGLSKPEGVGSEFADVLIRLLDTCDVYGIDLAAEFGRKLAYNRTRPYQHGGRTLAEGGGVEATLQRGDA